MKKSESDIESRLRKSIQSIGGMCLKLVTPNYTGIPDRLILLPGGVAIFAETKRPGEKERARQRYVQEQLCDLGFTVYGTVDSYEKVEEITRECARRIADKAVGV